MGFGVIGAGHCYLQLQQHGNFCSGRTNIGEHFILSCTSATHQQRFRADVFKIPPTTPSPNVMCHPIEHPAHIQASMTLPTRPNAIFSTLQGTQNPDTKPTLQRAKNANAQPTAPQRTNIHHHLPDTSTINL